MIPTEDFRKFVEAVYNRLEIGQQEYGDRSFQREPAALIDEIQQELADVCGWAFILHCRLAEIRKRLAPMS